jgi:WD40 repeat protein
VADETEAALWDVETGRHVPVAAGERPVTAFAWAAVGGETLLLTAHTDAGVQMWSLDGPGGAPPARRGRLLNHSLPVRAMAAFRHGDRALLATGGADGSVRLWDLEHRREAACWDDHGLGVRDLAVLRTRDGTLVVSAGADGTLRLGDPADPAAPRPVIHCGQQGVHAVAAVPAGGNGSGEGAGYGEDGEGAGYGEDGEAPLLASAGEDGTVRLWDPVTRRPAGAALDAGDGPVTVLAAFRTPAGRPCLAAGGPAGTVHLWDVAARTRLLSLVTGSPLTALAVRHPGREPAGRRPDHPGGTPTDPYPVLLAAGRAGICLFGVHLERY